MLLSRVGAFLCYMRCYKMSASTCLLYVGSWMAILLREVFGTATN